MYAHRPIIGGAKCVVAQPTKIAHPAHAVSPPMVPKVR